MTISNAIAPSTEPSTIQRYQCTNISTLKNTVNNKYWGFRFWEKEGIIQYFWGSVGKEASNSPKTVYGTLNDANRMAASKTNPRNKSESRYTQVILQSKSNPPPQLSLVANTPPQSSLHPDIAKLISYVFGTANSHIQSYLKGTIDALDIDQLNMGRNIIVEARNLLPVYTSGSRDQVLLDTMNRYYTAIPTILSKKRITADDRVKEFYTDLNQFEDRIDQLEAALSTYQYTQTQPVQTIDPVLQQYQSLGIELTSLSQSDTNYGAVVDFIESTKMNEKAKIHRLYAVTIPDERRRFNQWVANYVGNKDVSAANSKMLFHGTARQNGRHIIKTGLKIMSTAANGTRFGDRFIFCPKFR